MPSVSHSEIESFLQCRRKHYYSYGLSIERVNTSNALARGTAGHAVLESFYRTLLSAGPDPKLQRLAFDNALSVAWQTFNELPTGYDDSRHLELQAILFDWYFPNEPFVRQGWQVLAVEKEFNLEYDPDTHAQYPFVVDLILFDPMGATVVVDHKFVYDFYSIRDTRLMPQIPKYIGALRGLNYRVDYGVYNMLRTRPLKTSSKNDVLDRSLTLEMHPSGQRVMRSFEEQIGAAREVQARKALPIEEQEKIAYRTANKTVCQHCSFVDICEIELEGGNAPLMLKSEYRPRKRRNHIEVSDDAD